MARMARPTRTGEHGFAYLALLIVIAVMGVGLTAVSALWQTAQQRTNEQELIFVGEQYRKAIQQYYESSATDKKYPMSLDLLLADTRYPGARRYLRKPYLDPFTNSTKWGLVLAPQGGIMGVYSLGTGTPIKQAGFKESLAAFEGKTSYAEWKFVYLPIAH